MLSFLSSRLSASAFIITLCLFVTIGLTGCSDDIPTDQAGDSTVEDLELKSGNHGNLGQAVQNFAAELSGDEVVPPVETDARGLAKFQLNKAGDELSFRLNVANIENVIGAHIHSAPSGENGPIVVFLFGNPLTDAVTLNGTLAEGTITSSDVVGPLAGDFDALLEAMKNGNTYVQVHTVENRPGEIRGQIDHGNAVRPGAVTAKVKHRPPEEGDSNIKGQLTITDDGETVRVTRQTH